MRRVFSIDLFDEEVAKCVANVVIDAESLPMLVVWRRRYFMQYHHDSITYFEIVNVARAK